MLIAHVRVCLERDNKHFYLIASLSKIFPVEIFLCVFWALSLSLSFLK